MWSKTPAFVISTANGSPSTRRRGEQTSKGQSGCRLNDWPLDHNNQTFRDPSSLGGSMAKAPMEAPSRRAASSSQQCQQCPPARRLHLAAFGGRCSGRNCPKGRCPVPLRAKARCNRLAKKLLTTLHTAAVGVRDRCRSSAGACAPRGSLRRHAQPKSVLSPAKTRQKEGAFEPRAKEGSSRKREARPPREPPRSRSAIPRRASAQHRLQEAQEVPFGAPQTTDPSLLPSNVSERCGLRRIPDERAQLSEI